MKHRSNAGAAVHAAVKNANNKKDDKISPKLQDQQHQELSGDESSEISEDNAKVNKPKKSTQEVGTIVGGGSEVVLPSFGSKRSVASHLGGPSSSAAPSSSKSSDPTQSGAPPPTATNKSNSSQGTEKPPSLPKSSDRAPTSSKSSSNPPSASASKVPENPGMVKREDKNLDKGSSSKDISKGSSSKATDKSSASKPAHKSSSRDASSSPPPAKDKSHPAKHHSTKEKSSHSRDASSSPPPAKEKTPPKAEKAADPKPSKAVKDPVKDPVPTKEKDVPPKPNKPEKVAVQENPEKAAPAPAKVAPAPAKAKAPQAAPTSQAAPAPQRQTPVQQAPAPIVAVAPVAPAPMTPDPPRQAVPTSQEVLSPTRRGEGLSERMGSFMRVEHNPMYRESGLPLRICEHNCFEPVCLLVIVLNAIWIGVELDLRDPDAGDDDTPLYTDVVENVFCAIFSFEILVRIIVYKKFYYFFIDPLKRMWNIFDLLLVLLLVLETWVLKHATDGVDLPALSSLRLLRLLRIVRVLRMVPELSMMVKSLVAAIRSVSMTFLLAVGIMYIFSILLTQWARDYTPKEPCDHPINCVDKAFGTISKSFLTLMQILCFDATFSLIRAILDESIFHGLLLILFILIAAFTVLNMLIGVVCEIVAETNEGEREKVMRDKVLHLFASLDADGSGYISHEEMKNPQIPAELAKAGIENDVLQSTLKILETRRAAHNDPGLDDGHLELDEFLETIFKLLHPPEAQDILLILRKLERLEKALTDNVIVVPKGKTVGPSVDVQKKIGALQQQVAAMTRHVLEANAVYAGDSASAEYAWDHELRQLDKSMVRLRVRLERCVEEQQLVDAEESFLPAELKHWRLLCSEVVLSLNATGALINEGLKEHLVEKPLPALTADLTPFPQEPRNQPMLMDANSELRRDEDLELRRDMELRKDAENRREMEQRREAESRDAAWDADLSRGRAPKCPQGHACMFFFTPEDGWVCDSCDIEQAAGTGMWGCRQCEFDFCKDCSTLQELGQLESILEQQPLESNDQQLQQIQQMQQPPPGPEAAAAAGGTGAAAGTVAVTAAPPTALSKAPRCPVGHTCELFYTDEAGWTCDICRREQASGTPMWGCRQCEQDFCQSCSDRQLQAPKCLLGHVCTLFITDEDGWICDLCQVEQARGTELWACRFCEQDFCQSCGDAMGAPKPPECPEGHSCECFMTSEYGWICDICNEEQVERTEMWGCRQCEFDACMRCAAFKVASGGSWGETAV